MATQKARARPLGALLHTGTTRRRVLLGVAGVAGTLALWHVVTTRLHLVSQLSLPSPEAVLERLVVLGSTAYLGETLWGHALASIKVVLLAWALAGVVGVLLGVGVTWNRIIRNLALPIFQMLRSISPIAWIPIALVWLGIDDSARVFIVFIAAVVPWTVNTMAAVLSVDPVLLRAARTLGAGRRTLPEVVLPACLPTLLAGARIALGNAWTALIAAELLAASAGLGFVALNSSRVLDTPTMLAAMLTIGALGVLFSAGMLQIARVLTPWTRS